MDLILKDGDEEILVEPDVSTKYLTYTDDFLRMIHNIMELVEQREYAKGLRVML